MILLLGKGVSKGVVSGPVYFYRRKRVASRLADSPSIEKGRFSAAQQAAAHQLLALAARCRGGVGDEAALLFETHSLLAQDEDFTEHILSLIDQTACSAEQAVHQAAEHFADAFASMDDAYMQARAVDIRDVSRRILRCLTGSEEAGVDSPIPVILAADDLTPSETVHLDKSKILAFITQKGSVNSHTAILARTLGIPAVCSLGEQLKPEYAGRDVCVDGETGQVVVDPDEDTLTALHDRLAWQREQKALLNQMIGMEDTASDGQRLDICCNIGSAEEVEAVLANDGRGIGLFRSEFLFLAADDYPSEEVQLRAYQTVAAAMNGKRVVIRTLDVGADKQVGYFGLKKEENPALGLRAVRVCLNRPELFRTQLRAIYRASAFGRIAILFPMITSVWEIRECRRICRTVMEELDREGIPYSRDTEIGVMIETPASVFIADELAAEADFFSIGTNDLTQYILACDRQSDELDRYFDSHHPAVLRALKAAITAAHQAGIWAGVCGDLCADPEQLPVFLSVGADEISVPPGAVLPLRAQLRSVSAKESACASIHL